LPENLSVSFGGLQEKRVIHVEFELPMQHFF
jgi:hypothetical protein